MVSGPIVVQGTARVSQNGGAVTLGGGGTYSAFDVMQGTLRLGRNNGVATMASLAIGTTGSATFDLAGFDQTLTGITRGSAAAAIGSTSTTADATLTLTGSSTFTGRLQDTLPGGSRRLNLAVAGGTLRLAAANTYSGTTAVGNGTLWLDDPAGLGADTLRLLAGGTAAVGQAGSLTARAVAFAGGSLDVGMGRLDIAAGGIDQATLVTQLLAGRETDPGAAPPASSRPPSPPPSLPADRGRSAGSPTTTAR